jgi:bla regulator protein blaR1
MISYILEVSLCWLVFYAIYGVLLSRETFFSLNRWYLLVTALLGLAIPATEFYWPGGAAESLTTYYLQPVTIGIENLENAIVVTGELESGIGVFDALIWVYWTGVIVSATRFLFGLWQLHVFFKKGKITRQPGYTLVTSDEPHMPFSFLKYLFWSQTFEADGEDKQNIFRHEEAHIFQWHSIDVMLLEILGILFWCSPFIYLYKNSMKAVHEYLADDYVLKAANKKEYGHLLLRQAQSHPRIAIMNALFNSQLKKRIVMMTKTKSSQRASLKYFAALPLMALLFLAFSFSGKTPPAQNATPGEPVTVAADTIPAGDEIFKIVEEMPLFADCEEAITAADKKVCSDEKMIQFIYTNIRYPAAARKNKTEGMVVVKFVIEKDGNISGADIIRSIGDSCDEEVLRVVGMMPKWTPGKQRGRTVRVQFNLPVKFKLDTEAPKAANAPAPDIDAMPLFAGCDDATDKDKCSKENLFKFINENLKYPAEAKRAGVGGNVIVRFTVSKDGSVRDATFVRGIGHGCNEEALRVVNLMPAWTPGLKNGQPVDVSLVLPFAFKTDELAAKPSSQVAYMNVYPNPATDEISIKFKATPGDLELRLIGANGKILKRMLITDYEGEDFETKFRGLSKDKAPRGSYFLSLTDMKNDLLQTVPVILK